MYIYQLLVKYRFSQLINIEKTKKDNILSFIPSNYRTNTKEIRKKFHNLGRLVFLGGGRVLEEELGRVCETKKI